ncbi:MAG TPA: hypothetical protein VFM33_01120 [Aquabacterium sp.]|nr:hypothetical protein [Aquabacterium sp.]
MTDTKQTTIIEINGVKMEVDLRNAKRIDQLQIGSRVKCLIKTYSDFKTSPGVIVGFEPFEKLPSIVVAYLDVEYGSANLVFKTFNSETKDFEIVADLDNNTLEVNRADILKRFEREEAKKELELEEIRQKKEFFLSKFAQFFEDKAVA